MGDVPAKNLVPRGTRIPLPPGHWWPVEARKAAERRAEKLGIRPPGIRSLVDALAEMKVKIDEDTLGRCLRGEIVTWEVAVPLSKILGIPPPAIIPTSPEDGEAMQDAEELRTIRAALDRLKRADRQR